MAKKKKEEAAEEQKQVAPMPKVYSPDITPYSFEGDSYFFGTVLSILVAPVRLVSRVMHNIFVLPADLCVGYANSLFIVSGILFIIGLVSLLLDGKWVLALSQLPVLGYVFILRRQAKQSVETARNLHEVEIDVEEIEVLCNGIYTELNEILGGNEE